MDINILGIIAKGNNAVVGIERIKTYFKKIKYKRGFFIAAEDASLKTKRKALYLKEKYNLPLIEKFKKKEIGKFFKKEEVSTLYIKKRGFLKFFQEEN